MEIISKLIKIKKNSDLKLIEEDIKAQGLTPLRWAIVDVLENEFVISVAHENLC